MPYCQHSHLLRISHRIILKALRIEKAFPFPRMQESSKIEISDQQRPITVILVIYAANALLSHSISKRLFDILPWKKSAVKQCSQHGCFTTAWVINDTISIFFNSLYFSFHAWWTLHSSFCTFACDFRISSDRHVMIERNKVW